MTDLHAAIMNLQCRNDDALNDEFSDRRIAYKTGFRDARHAAAELASAALSAQPEPAAPTVVEPAGWFESPHGAFRANLLFRIKLPPQSLAWQIPLYVHPPRTPLTEDFQRECDAVDELLRHFGVDPERCRTEGGALNVARAKSLLGNWAVTNEMVNRFLGWKLPADFSPDAGITFNPLYNEHMPWGGNKHEPMGTNLLNADQARAMLEHVLGIAASEGERK